MTSRYPNVVLDVQAIAALRNQTVNARNIYVNASTNGNSNAVSQATSTEFGDGSNVLSGTNNAIPAGTENTITNGTNAVIVNGTGNGLVSTATNGAMMATVDCNLNQAESAVIAATELNVAGLASAYKNSNSLYTTNLYCQGNRVFLVNLPTSDPIVAGQLWTTGGAVRISDGLDS